MGALVAALGLLSSGKPGNHIFQLDSINNNQYTIKYNIMILL
jgi:hypothetical protein